jgi:hypothetical protein
METCVHLWYLADFFLEWEMFQICRENENTFCVQSFFSENRDIYKVMRKIMVQPDMPRMTL